MTVLPLLPRFRMHRPSRVGRWGGGVAVLLLAGGCFNVRQPEPATASAEWLPATQAEILLENFQRAIQQVNAATYERCFVGPSFQFLPDPMVAARTPGIFDQWRLDQERAYFQRLASRTSAAAGNSLTLTYPPQNVSFITTDSQLIQATYRLRLFQQDTAFKQSSFTGTARLTLVRRAGQNEWKIAAWQDTRLDPADHVWSEVKAYFFTH
ncbi:MAG: hypothetical protein H7330_09215 [Hymenobacteraceae bacterium]|nr:hypothetical protein [Hymenobacteraceae bacterium]